MICCTDYLLLRDEIEVRRARLDAELHDSGGDVVHVEGLDDLIAVWVIGRSDVDDLPVENARQGAEGLEGDLEGERIEHRGRVVLHYDVVYVNLGHITARIN